MNKKARTGQMFLLLGCFLFFFLEGCAGTGITIGKGPSQEPSPAYKKGGPPPWAPAHGYRAKHRYRYYPSSRVYYEKERGVYFYYRNGEWQVSVSLPTSLRLDVGDYVTLEMDTDRPYEYDNDVVRRYPPGQLKKQEKHKWKKDKGKGNKGKKKWD